MYCIRETVEEKRKQKTIYDTSAAGLEFSIEYFLLSSVLARTSAEFNRFFDIKRYSSPATRSDKIAVTLVSEL